MTSFCLEPKPGDLIEIFRTGYMHWAIYVGDGYVIHLAPLGEYPGAGASSLFSVLTSKAVVKRERLQDVVGSCRYRINNILDHKYRPRPVHKILKSANEMIGAEMGYSVLENNCEHFVTKLRYDKAECGQTKVAKVLIEGGVALGLGVLAVMRYSVLKKRSQNQ
ncbi:phospholipase A and acyltransferase 4 [Phacochoerus africanus]|uniref:phospholipase A and acyltransferase 4 n=1 Tax=Phacochoerus africanus TaxID=41426 RepID=UPI001FD99912|nr:phospholipase A and acyltransferase 4 [Phacochoerus africanus]